MVTAIVRLPSERVRDDERVTAGTLLALAGLHVAWGAGSPFPFKDSQTLADAVVGTQAVPRPAACASVATALAVGGVLVSDVPAIPARLRRFGLLAMACIFGLRGLLGFAAKTDRVSPRSNSAQFRRLDRLIYSPVCIALAAGSLAARN